MIEDKDFIFDFRKIYSLVPLDRNGAMRSARDSKSLSRHSIEEEWYGCGIQDQRKHFVIIKWELYDNYCGGSKNLSSHFLVIPTFLTKS